MAREEAHRRVVWANDADASAEYAPSSVATLVAVGLSEANGMTVAADLALRLPKSFLRAHLPPMDLRIHRSETDVDPWQIVLDPGAYDATLSAADMRESAHGVHGAAVDVLSVGTAAAQRPSQSRAFWAQLTK